MKNSSEHNYDSESLRKQEATADEFKHRFEIAAELCGDGLLILDKNNQLVFSSKKAAALWGYSQEELVSIPIEEVFPQDSLNTFKLMCSQAVECPGQLFNACLSALRVHDREMDVEITLFSPEKDREIYITLSDVSLSKNREKEFFKSNQFLRNVILNSVVGIISFDAKGNILLFNNAAGRMLGWSEREVAGFKNLYDFFDASDADHIMEMIIGNGRMEEESGMFCPMEISMMKKSGEVFPVNFSLSSIYEWDQQVALVGVFTDQSERAAIEKELKQTRDYLNNVVQNAFDMIITTDLDANMVSFNRGGERILGYSSREMIGKSVEMLYPNPEERRSLLRRVHHFDGAVSNYETKLIHKNGSLVDISLTLSLLTDKDGRTMGTVGISKDITAHKKAEEELKQTKDYLNAIVENTTDMIITTDLDKKIVSFNRGAEIMLGYQRDEVLGRHIEDFYLEPGERQAMAMYLDDEESSVNYETQLLAKDGKIVDIDLTLSQLRDIHDRVIGTVGISKDISESKRVEEELRQKKAELEEARIQVMHSEKMASLGKLATSVAHEINNPLGGILMFCEIVLEEIQTDHPNRKDLLQIREQTLKCKDIVKGLLDFGRMTGAKYAFIDLNRTVEQGIALFANQALFQNIKVIWELAVDLPQILGDARQLNQVFTNLIINAVDAMNGHGVLTVRTEVKKEEEEVRVSFIDTGHGIEPHIIPRLFEPFFTTKPVGEGVGLGLSTSYGIVKSHNGRIEVESEAGSGSIFTVCLPMVGPEQDA